MSGYVHLGFFFFEFQKREINYKEDIGVKRDVT